MAGKRRRTPTPAEAALGEAIAARRLRLGLSQMDVARALRITQQQIELYEKGAFVPLPVMEALGEALDCPIQKRVIRQISNLRKREMEERELKPELILLYQEAFNDDYSDE